MPQDSELREKGRLRYSAFFHMSVEAETACRQKLPANGIGVFFAMNRNKLVWDCMFCFLQNFFSVFARVQGLREPDAVGGLAP